MNPYFEHNKNQNGGLEMPFYAGSVTTETDGYQVGHHWHHHMEILYIDYGMAKVYTQDEECNMQGGQLILIYPCEVHAVTVEKKMPSRHYIIGFDAELLSPMPSLAFELRYLMPYIAAMSPRQKVIFPTEEESHWIRELASDTLDEYRQEHTGYELMVTSNIYQLLNWILRNHSHQLLADSVNSLPALHRSKLDAVQEVLRYIDDHYDKDISTSDLSQISFMSYSHLAKLFKSIMHTPLTKYINFVRIRKAEQLLLNPEKSIAEIALETGFSASSYFIEQFKRTKGISPHQYRKRLLQR
ncbi:MAG: AraC family transcriptional regulator [Paenibacillus sp.]|jgi:AraC-like DNA-binding protein|nr:AraC family transcriptional regulator [Paenibacillus sp.]